MELTEVELVYGFGNWMLWAEANICLRWTVKSLSAGSQGPEGEAAAAVWLASYRGEAFGEA
jgi:hypothetical protein